jgi:hypothetical protein
MTQIPENGLVIGVDVGATKVAAGFVANMLSPCFEIMLSRLPARCVNSRCLEIPLVPARYEANVGIAGGPALCAGPGGA